PPLGRWLLGIASSVGEPFEFLILGPDPIGLFIRSARIAPALAFGALVGLVTSFASRHYGRAAGLAAGFSLLAMPRMFAHAHFAALDTFVALFWTLALFKADAALSSNRPYRRMVVAGVFWGLALLIKIHGWFLIPVVLIWAFLNLPWRQ